MKSDSVSILLMARDHEVEDAEERRNESSATLIVLGQSLCLTAGPNVTALSSSDHQTSLLSRSLLRPRVRAIIVTINVNIDELPLP